MMYQHAAIAVLFILSLDRSALAEASGERNRASPGQTHLYVSAPFETVSAHKTAASIDAIGSSVDVSNQTVARHPRIKPAPPQTDDGTFATSMPTTKQASRARPEVFQPQRTTPATCNICADAYDGISTSCAWEDGIIQTSVDSVGRTLNNPNASKRAHVHQNVHAVNYQAFNASINGISLESLEDPRRTTSHRTLATNPSVLQPPLSPSLLPPSPLPTAGGEMQSNGTNDTAHSTFTIPMQLGMPRAQLDQGSILTPFCIPSSHDWNSARTEYATGVACPTPAPAEMPSQGGRMQSQAGSDGAAAAVLEPTAMLSPETSTTIQLIPPSFDCLPYAPAAKRRKRTVDLAVCDANAAKEPHLNKYGVNSWNSARTEYVTGVACPTPAPAEMPSEGGRMQSVNKSQAGRDGAVQEPAAVLSPEVSITMQLKTQPRVQHGPGPILTLLPFKRLPSHTRCGASTSVPKYELPYNTRQSVTQPPLGWLLFAASTLLLRILGHYVGGVKMKARCNHYLTKMHARKRKRLVRVGQHLKHAIFLPLVAVAMLFAGHLPDAADGKAIVAPDGKSSMSTVANWARDSIVADAASGKHEWEATRSDDAPDLSSLPLPQPKPLKPAPPPPALPQTRTRADDIDSTKAATTPTPKMMMMEAAVVEEEIHHYPAYLDEAKGKQRSIVDPAAAALGEMNPTPRTFEGGNDNKRGKLTSAPLNQKTRSGKWPLEQVALSAEVTVDGWLPPSRASSVTFWNVVGKEPQRLTQRRRRQQNDFDSTTLKAACDAWCADEDAAREKYGDIAGWKVGNVESFEDLFLNQLKFNADLSKWDLSSATTTHAMFWNAHVFNSNISKWSLGGATSTQYMFFGALVFNSDLSKWDMSSVTDTTMMFYNARKFDQDLDCWQLHASAITSSGSMFTASPMASKPPCWYKNDKVVDGGCTSAKCGNTTATTTAAATTTTAMISNNFNSTTLKAAARAWCWNEWAAREKYGAIAEWKVGNVKSFYELFFNICRKFNADISKWNMGSATSTEYMFHNAYAFNSDISKWNMGSATTTYGMFLNAYAFNSDISKWNLGSAKDTSYMFDGASAFNTDLSKWNMGSATSTARMFASALVFNADISKWNIGNAMSTDQMFYDASTFNSDISKWDLSSVKNTQYMFNQASKFDQDLDCWQLDASAITSSASMFASSPMASKPPCWYKSNKVVDGGCTSATCKGAATTTTSTTSTTFTTTAVTFVAPGATCTLDGECYSGSCRTRCCSIEAADAAASNPGACSACSAATAVGRTTKTKTTATTSTTTSYTTTTATVTTAKYTTNHPNEENIQPCRSCFWRVQEQNAALAERVVKATSCLEALAHTECCNALSALAGGDFLPIDDLAVVGYDDEPVCQTCQENLLLAAESFDCTAAPPTQPPTTVITTTEKPTTTSSPAPYDERGAWWHGGACYSKLALRATWGWPEVVDGNGSNRTGWLPTFERDEKSILSGPPNETVSSLNFKGAADQVTFRLVWGPNPTSNDALPVRSAELENSSPPPGLKPAGEGLDPGLFDIDPKTGAISALPRRVGSFSMYLIANDGAGTAADVGLPAEFDQVVVRRWDFNVVGKPNFKVVSYDRIQPGNLAKGSDTDAPYAASGKIGMLNCTVGTTYRIAPIDKTNFAYQYASGGVGAKVRFTIRHPPPGFFIDPDTGEIQGKPQSGSVRTEPYTSTLLAIDAGGGEAELEKIRFAVFEQPQFNFVAQPAGQRAERPGVKYSDPTVGSTDEFFVGEDYSYKVAPLLINKTATTVSFGSLDDVTYTLSSGAPASFFVQARSGVIFGQFETAGKVQFSLLAVDKAGKTAVVELYTFNAVDRGTFHVLEYAHTGGTDGEQHNLGDHDFTDPATTTPYAIGETYKFAPVEISAAEHTDDVLSELEFSLKDAPEGFLINPTNGYIQGTPTERGEHTMQLFAVDSLNNRALVENITLSIKPKDVDVNEYGPNGHACEHGTAVDEIAFDEAFVCDCNATVYEGNNCDVPIRVASASGGNTPVVTGATAGAFIFIFFVGLILYKRRMFAIKMKAFDFKAEVERLIGAGEIDEAEDGAEEGARIPREIKRAHVVMIQQIGEGAFGEVWKAVLDESSAGGVPGYQVAVKTSKDAKGEGADEMLREATVMAQVSGHPNLVSLIGVVTSGVPLLLAISMCEHGSLLSLLKERTMKGKAEGGGRFTLAERIGFAIDTAKGMAHLTANSFVHRDLAARNVLVDATMTCKVADFGLARGIAGARAGPDTNEDGEEEEYYRSRTGTFPVRWTSPEAMQTMRFSEATDCWSFGITLVEIFTDGGKPYAGMANAAVISQVQGGYRAPQPKLCNDAVYTVMLQCWCAKPADRPTFAQLETLLQTAAEDAGAATTSNATSGGAGETSKKKKNKKKTTTTTKADQRQAVAVNDTYMSDAPAEATRGGSRQSVAVNDTYMTDEPAPAEEMADQYLTVDNAGGAVDAGGEAGADDEYLSVAAGLRNGTIDDGLDSGSDIEL